MFLISIYSGAFRILLGMINDTKSPSFNALLKKYTNKLVDLVMPLFIL